jgi:hypothetical protein
VRKRLSLYLGMAIVAALTIVPGAFASGGAAPTFNVTDLTPKINDYASTLLVGAIALVGVVLIAIVPFQLLKMGVGYVRKWFGGRGKAASPA